MSVAVEKTIVILQPQYIPWMGVFEQIRLADIFVHYDDVQYPQGRSFTSRVQVKTVKGQQWISIPVNASLKGRDKPYMINEVRIDNTQKWQRKHFEVLRHNYAKAEFADDMLSLADDILGQEVEFLSNLNIYALEKISAYFGFTPRFERSSTLNITSHSTQRLIDVCNHFEAKTYITGLGARNYVDYDSFEENAVKLHYMNYEAKPYSQFYGEFTPYVTILDLIAHQGQGAVEYLCSQAQYWKDIPNVMDL
jgi:hypothetical protein